MAADLGLEHTLIDVVIALKYDLAESWSAEEILPYNERAVPVWMLKWANGQAWCKPISWGLIPDGSPILGACPTYMDFLENGGIEDANNLIKATMKRHLLEDNKIIELPSRRASRATRGVQSDIERKSDIETKRYLEFRRLNQCRLDIKPRK